MIERPGTAWKHLEELYRGGPHASNAMWAGRVLKALDRIAPWILVDVEGNRELEFHISTGHGAARVTIESASDFMEWAGDELGALGLATKSEAADRAVDCCALWIQREVMEAMDPGVGGVTFKEWPREAWPVYQAGFIAGYKRDHR